MSVFGRRMLLAAAAPALAQSPRSRVLRFVPHASLTSIDPVVSTALITRGHAYLVYDTLYALGEGYVAEPQMAAGHRVEEDGLRWTIGLREGLRFHDGEPVRAPDVLASIRRWAQRDSFGQSAMAAVAEMRATHDRELTIRLHRPFPRLLDAMAKTSPMFVMPERIAAGDAGTALTDPTGSGPYRFLRDEWVPGARAAYRRHEGYVPRDEPARMLAGGKHARFDRIEWHIIPDPATAAAALQAGEVDWWEVAQADQLDRLARIPGIVVEQLNPLGTIHALRPNHTQPPFHSGAVRRAIWPALSQADAMIAAAGTDRTRWRDGVGFFTPDTPLASRDGMEALDGPRSLDTARRALEASGYRGETLAFLHPTDIPAVNAVATVAADLLRRIGFTVDDIPLDWAATTQRRNRRGPPSQGGWSTFPTVLGGADCLNPATNLLLRADGAEAFFGWPDSPGIEAGRLGWYDAPSISAQQAIAHSMQRDAFATVPYWPLGQVFHASAYRRGMTGFVRAPVTVQWNVAGVA